MDGEIDFSTYSLQQLREAETGINSANFPRNFARLQEELHRRGMKPVPAPVATGGSSPSEAMPSTVRTAVRLLRFSIGVGVLNAILNWSYFAALASVSFLLLVWIVTFGILLWLFHKIALGRNWARITLLVLTVVGVMTFLGSILEMAREPILVTVLGSITWLLQVVALYKLFAEPHGGWFKQRHEP